MKVKSTIIATMLLSVIAYADPAPFGLEIGKATVSGVKAKYSTTYTGVNKYSNGDVYDLDVSELSLDGLESATVIFFWRRWQTSRCFLQLAQREIQIFVRIPKKQIQTS